MTFLELQKILRGQEKLAKSRQARRRLHPFFTTLDICNTAPQPGTAFVTSHTLMYIKATEIMPRPGQTTASEEESELLGLLRRLSDHDPHCSGDILPEVYTDARGRWGKKTTKKTYTNISKQRGTATYLPRKLAVTSSLERSLGE